jgi:hypothetical protein
VGPTSTKNEGGGQSLATELLEAPRNELMRVNLTEASTDVPARWGWRRVPPPHDLAGCQVNVEEVCKLNTPPVISQSPGTYNPMSRRPCLPPAIVNL